MKVLITGGSGGIGAEAVRLLREAGHDVQAPSHSDLDMSSGVSIGSFQRRLIEIPEAVVFCHGEWYSRPPKERGDYPLYHWTRQYDMRAVWPAIMMDRWLAAGALQSVVMVSSTRALIGGVNTGPYSAACAAQVALMQGYAREWPGCRFNAVCPGWTDTAMGKEVAATGGVVPGRVAQAPAAVAKVIMELLTGDANGEIIEVTGGRVTRAHWQRGGQPWR